MSDIFMPFVDAADNASSIFAAMKAARRWLIWQEVTRVGRSKPDKVPFYSDGTPRGVTDTLNDLALLATYGDACQSIALLGDGWGLGFALGRDAAGAFWQGIDLDNIGENRLSDLADALLGYVEVSPSGKGVHAIGYGRHFRSLGSNGSGIEAYSGGRFFTVTENMVRNSGMVCLADYVEHALASRHRTKASNPPPDSKASAIVKVSAQTVADLRSALNHMRSDDYALWIEIGHALKPLGDTGRGLWLDWSATSSKFEPHEASRKWEGFDPQHTGYRAVFAKAQELGWVNPASNASILADFVVDDPTDKTGIAAAPFVMPAFFEIPPRPWILGHWLLRGTVTTVIAPGGTGKSSLMVAFAISLASGRELLGKDVWGGPKRVWLWNLEDDRDELDRQIAACCLHHDIASGFPERLFVNDAGSSLCTATRGRDGLAVHDHVNKAISVELKTHGIDVLIIDPFVSSHRAEENDNGQIDRIVKRWSRIAREANCSIVLVHHSRKQAGQMIGVDSARGASALSNAARTVLVLNRMEKSEAARLGVASEERRFHFRVSNDKSNRAPVEVADWFHLTSVELQNGGPQGGDSVAVVECWSPSELVSDIDDENRARIQTEIAAGEWRAHHSANDWAGNAIAKVIKADRDDPNDRQRIKMLLRDMLKKGQLRTERRNDANRKTRDFVIIGTPIEVLVGRQNL